MLDSIPQARSFLLWLMVCEMVAIFIIPSEFAGLDVVDTKTGW